MEGKIYTALITPFKNDKIDYDSYFKILDNQVENGITGVIPCGTTGESPTLTHKEHNELVEKTVQYIDKRVKVIAGAGSNSTREAIEFTENAHKSNADGVLMVNPYYNKPTQKGLFKHFEEISKVANPLTVMLYNIPGRSAVNLSIETIMKLADIPNITSIKEASGNLSQMASIISELEKQKKAMEVLSGDDAMTLPLLSVGGKGVVSVVSNLFPRSMVELVENFFKGNIKKSCEMQKVFYRFFQICFVETNPIPIKAAMNFTDFCENELRLPLTQLDKKFVESLQKEIQDLKSQGFK